MRIKIQHMGLLILFLIALLLGWIVFNYMLYCAIGCLMGLEEEVATCLTIGCGVGVFFFSAILLALGFTNCCVKKYRRWNSEKSTHNLLVMLSVIVLLGWGLILYLTVFGYLLMLMIGNLLLA